LDIAERNTGVKTGDERMPQGVRTNSLVDPGTSGDSSNNSGGAMAIETATGTITEDRTAAAFPDGEIDSAGGSRGERDRDSLAALAMNDEGAVTALETELFDVSTDRFGDAKPVQREQRDRGVITGSGESGGDEHCADLVAVQTSRVGLVVEAWPADMHGW
jgi:hypothetical protein